MNERKMARIVKVDSIVKHPNADSLDIVTVGGWNCVTKLNEFKQGDLAIYCEIDSWIPHNLAPFLSKGNEPREYNGVKGERLRTAKLRGVVSQGLLLPRTVTPHALAHPLAHALGFMFATDETVGEDVSQWLGIQKWEAPLPANLAGIALGAFPTACPRTDEERIQNLTEDWPMLRGLTYEVTEKLEGSSMTVGMIEGVFVVCSRNLSLKEVPESTLWQQARRYDVEQKLRDLGIDNLVMQGELIGEGVQKNYYGIYGHEWHVFSVYDIAKARYLDSQERLTLCQQLGLNHAPVIDAAFKFDADATIDSVLAMADGASMLNPQRRREGLVFKQVNHPTDQHHWKAISNAYLIKHAD